MKKITLTLFFLFTCFVSFAQVATVKTIRVVNPTTAIGENIPVGTIIIDVSTNKMYVAKIGIASSETITTSIANLDLKIATSSIVDNLTAGGATVPLSAQQGVDLNNLITSSTVDVTDNLGSTVTTDALSANQGKVLKDLVDLNVTTASIVNDLSTGGTTVPLSAEQGKALNALITNKKQSYLHTDTFSETSGTASAHALTKAVTATATNEVNFKVSVNGGEVLATAITYDSGDNTITLSGISVAQYDLVTVVYTTNE